MQCELCGGPLRRDSKTGVCKRNPECLRENKQRRYGEDDRVRARAHYWENPEKSRARRRQSHESTRHEAVTYLRYSPGLKLHKLGHTVNLANNTQQLRRGCPDIQLVATFPYGLKLEGFLKDRFRATRISGTEWFSDITEADVREAVREWEEVNA